MFMQAVVIEVYLDRLLVIDLDTRQNVIVNTLASRQFRPGNVVNIWYDGIMTNSIPPQINALQITVDQFNGFPPAPPVRPCPPNVCLPNIRPPFIWPPILFPPVGRPPVRPPVGRPPVRPPVGPPPRPPVGRPPNPPGRPR